MIDLNNFGEITLQTAYRRGKCKRLSEDIHRETFLSLNEELNEFDMSSESAMSEHIPLYTEAEEELADLLIVALTELSRRRVNVEEIITSKALYNQSRT